MKRFLSPIFQIRQYATKPTEISKIRNIGIVAHIDAGKTTTTERMLFYAGLTKRLGNVDEGDTVTDYLDAERQRGITIQSAAVTVPWNSYRINLIDTPGHADFTFEVVRSLRVLDGCVVILDGVAGVEAQTEKVWRQAKNHKIPTVVYVNKMDRDGAGFGRTVKEVVAKLGTRVVLVNVPFFSKEGKFEGVLDVVRSVLLKWPSLSDGKKVETEQVSESHFLYSEVQKCRESMIETLTEFDEAVVDSFLENEEDYMKVPVKVIEAAIRKGTLSRAIAPVLCGASFRNIGVQPLLDAVTSFLPSPVEVSPPNVESILRASQNIPVTVDPLHGCVVAGNRNLAMALAFKVITHPVRGVMVFIRVYSGRFQSGSTVVNTKSGQAIRLGKLLTMHADVPEEVQSVTSGNIGVITGTASEITTGDTLVCHSVKKSFTGFPPREKNAHLMPIPVPPPVFSVSLEPETVGQRRKLEESLDILMREDPSLKLSSDEETGQIILSGMGELHLDIAVNRLVNEFKAKVVAGDIMVSYKETLLSATPVVALSREVNGSVFSIKLSLEPLGDDVARESFSIDNNVISFNDHAAPESIASVWNDIAREKLDTWPFPLPYEAITSSIVSGCNASLQTGGVIAKLALYGVSARIHSWDIPREVLNESTSSLSPLLTLTREAVLDALSKLQPHDVTLVEPVMNVSVFVKDQDVGVISQDLMSTRKAHILAIDEQAAETSEDLYWAKEESEKTYVPADPTLEYMKSASLGGKKIIKAVAPLKEMIGYLSKLRSLTRGSAIYDMVYKGMEPVSADRLKGILDT